MINASTPSHLSFQQKVGLNPAKQSAPSPKQTLSVDKEKNYTPDSTVLKKASVLAGGLILLALPLAFANIPAKKLGALEGPVSAMQKPLKEGLTKVKNYLDDLILPKLPKAEMPHRYIPLNGMR